METLICQVLSLYLIVVFARILLSWFPTSPGSFVAQISEITYRLTEPVMGPLRRVLPPLSFGSTGLDLSPIVVIIGINILIGTIC